jgi:cell division protein FtsB|tara:strand:- start:710 stop:1018 length:309 start_codon:yes stop_codon:yes gene_type:complete
MNNYLIRKKFVSNSITILTFIIFVFFISHIFFGERSVWKIFSLNSQIVAANKEYNKLINNKKNIMTEINLLRDNNLDSDYITEISYDLLGLIQSDQIVIDIK